MDPNNNQNLDTLKIKINYASKLQDRVVKKRGALIVFTRERGVTHTAGSTELNTI